MINIWSLIIINFSPGLPSFFLLINVDVANTRTVSPIMNAITPAIVPASFFVLKFLLSLI